MNLPKKLALKSNAFYKILEITILDFVLETFKHFLLAILYVNDLNFFITSCFSGLNCKVTT